MALCADSSRWPRQRAKGPSLREVCPCCGRHFQVHFLEWKCINFIKFSLKFVPKGPINTISALVKLMAWRRPGDKPLSEPMIVSLLTHICVTRPQWVNHNSEINTQFYDVSLYLVCFCPGTWLKEYDCVTFRIPGYAMVGKHRAVRPERGFFCI